MENCFVFRTSDNEFVQSELKGGYLRQGWSPPGTSLLGANGGERGAEDWSQAYGDAWGENPSPRRYSILRRMLDMKEDDLIFCPKAPDYKQFTIARVDEEYRFDVATDQKDFGHIIRVKDRHVVSNWHSQDSQTICALFRSANFRSAINLVPEYKREDVVSAAKRLWQREDTLTSVSSDKLLKERVVTSRKEAANFFIEYVNNKWGPHQFEEAVGEAFERKGYERLWGNSSRNGGDADHVFSLPMPGFDEVESLDRIPLLIVQVKHKKGRDYNDVEGVNQLVKWDLNENETADYTVLYKTLFTSADSFTPECKKIAEKNDIMLICGTEAGQFML